ncbi:precorrin-4/cobalt-precorrin-4 C11-methyltransferase [Malonomonas rubra DSM 5091]|uniref:Precorrin-4/cobalt-precorrin-4 C11-methyltransferase n=1 Tax=Malonomonas rubra DSM 5091 TaxID=1122189 RepID=A0A1M6DB22_MALRU|nr:SAM-dependent methyltransferase [Malonomonas rubra]SHI70301.1 precorrin-4/cobalt-precorrin-4 C11-methyltransferase [Malonomonas rubra DSM 5091]
MNRLFFVGAGPGDPQMLTLHGAEALCDCGVVYYSEPYDVAFADFLQGKELFDPFDFGFHQLLEQIESQLQKTSVAFLVPGDLTFYSPYQGIVCHFAEKAEVIPGVGVANVASARLKRTFDLPAVCNRALIVSPKTLGASSSAPELEELAARGVSLLIYMNNMPLEELVAKLHKGYGADVPIALFYRLGLPEEKVLLATLDSIVATCDGVDYFHLNEPEKRPALTFVVVGESLCAPVDTTWWDQKRQTDWAKRKKAGKN